MFVFQLQISVLRRQNCELQKAVVESNVRAHGTVRIYIFQRKINKKKF